MTFNLPDTLKPNTELAPPPPDPSAQVPWRSKNPYGGTGPLGNVRGPAWLDRRAPAAARPSGQDAEPALGGIRDSRSVTVLLPALNEEAAVGTVIDRVPVRALGRMGYRVRVCVVDGRSTDGTQGVARERGAEVFEQSGAGKGNGVRQALDYLMARPRAGTAEPLYVMLDSDGTYPPEQIHRLLAALESGADVVLGSRFLGHMEEGAITSLNRLGNRLLSRLASLLYRVPVSDVCTGMWGFREGCLRGFGLAAEGFDLEADLFSAACFAGVRVAEVPVDYHRRIGEPKLIPLRTGLLIGWRLLARRLNRPQVPARPQRVGRGRPAEGPT